MGKLLVLLGFFAIGAAGGGVAAALRPPAADAPDASAAVSLPAPGGALASVPSAAPGASNVGAAIDLQTGEASPTGDVASAGSPGSAYAYARSNRPGDASGKRSFIAVGRQLIIPVVRGGDTRALVLFELAIDVPASLGETAHAMLPRLRDAFLRELFAMSYTGAFDETYTDSRVIDEMRAHLRLAARQILGNEVADVLVLDVMRQEL